VTTGVIALSACISIEAPGNVDLQVYFNGVAGNVSAGAIAYGDAACNIQLGTLDSDPAAVTGAWQVTGLQDMALPTGTQSARVYLRVDPLDGSIGDVLFDHVRFAPSGTLTQDGIPIQEGLTGTWYNPLDGGQGFEFTVNDPPASDGVSLFFGAWFTYGDTAGGTDTQRWYSLQGSADPGATVMIVGIFQNVGGRFAAPPSTSAVQVGQAEIVYFSCTSALFLYSLQVNGSDQSGQIPIHGLLPNVECNDSGETGTPPASDFGLSGTWYDPSTGGQGLMVQVDPVNGQVFVGWYTYALDGGVDETSQRWLSAQAAYDVGSRSMDLSIYASTGGVFDSGVGGVTTTLVGTATLTFTSCTTATFDYDLTEGEFAGQFGTIDLTRLGAALESCVF
jgi:hypothetical protein